MNRIINFVLDTEKVFDRTTRYEIIKNSCVEYTSNFLENMINLRLSGKKKVVKNMGNNLKMFENKILEICVCSSFMSGLFESDYEHNFYIYHKCILYHYLYIQSLVTEKEERESIYDSACEIYKIFYNIYKQIKYPYKKNQI